MIILINIKKPSLNALTFFFPAIRTLSCEGVEINLYLTPNVTDTQINYFYLARIEDAGAYTKTPDAPYRFLPCMVSGLSFYLAQKHNPGRVQEMKLYYEDELQRALTEDGQRTSVHLVPQNFFRT